MSELKRRIRELHTLAAKNKVDVLEELRRLEEKLGGETAVTKDAWSHVLLARHPDRPRSLDYIKMIFDDFIELHGDRCYGDDPAMICGIAKFGDRYVTVLSLQKGRTMKENIHRNFGSANPEGYRKALRLALQAEKFGRPIVTFIDTQGAYPGMTAEERGIGEAIAVNLKVFAGLRVPVICYLIGEGGSGGALGIAVGNEIYMLENSVYSVISPEGHASILWNDSSRAPYSAGLLKMTAHDLFDFKVVDGIIPEPEGGAHTDPKIMADRIKTNLREVLERLCKKSGETLREERIEKFRRIGAFQEEVRRRDGFLRRFFNRRRDRKEG